MLCKVPIFILLPCVGSLHAAPKVQPSSDLSAFKAEWLRSFSDSSTGTPEPSHAADDDGYDDRELSQNVLMLEAAHANHTLGFRRPSVDLKSHTVEGLVDMWFSEIKPGSVTRDMFTSLQQKDVHSCTVLVVNNNSMYLPNKGLVKRFYNSRVFDLAWLIIQATQKERLPDVEILVCPGDAGIEFLRGAPYFDKVPVLAPVTRFTKVGTIPVPMLARAGKSYWGDNTVRSLLAGNRPFPEVPWKKKKRVAYFRGKYAPGPPCDLSRGPPSPHSHCYRDYLVKKLRSDRFFDMSQDEWVPESKFEEHMVLMVIGNEGGWSDRTMRTLFKSSATMYLDQDAYEWFIPLLVDGVDFMKVEPSPMAMHLKAVWAMRHDSELKAMVKAANARARKIFNLDTIVNYIALTVKAYAKTLAFKPRVRKGMEIFTLDA